MWLAIIVPVFVAAISFVARRLTARERIRKKYADDVSKARDRVRSVLIIQSVTQIVVKVHPMIEWPPDGLALLTGDDELGQPLNEVERRLSTNQIFVDPISDVVQYAAWISHAQEFQERVVKCETRQAISAGVFAAAWLYLAFWVSETGLALPKVLTSVAGLVLAGAFGWFAAERLASTAMCESFATMMNEVETKLGRVGDHDDGG